MPKHLTYANVMATLAVFIALGGTAYAVNTVGSSDVIDESLRSQDIKNGEVKVADIGQQAVATDELANGQVKAADIGDGEVRGADVANDNLTGGDIAGNTLKGADIDEATLDIGDSARAYAHLRPSLCTPTTCTPQQSKGVSSIVREGAGEYCVTVAGIDSRDVPAAVTVDWDGTAGPEGDASAMTGEIGCGDDFSGFKVFTERHAQVTVDSGGGTGSEVVSGRADVADNVAFTIVIP